MALMAGCECRDVPEECINSFQCILEMELPKLVFTGLTLILAAVQFGCRDPGGKIVKQRVGYSTFFCGAVR